MDALLVQYDTVVTWSREQHPLDGKYSFFGDLAGAIDGASRCTAIAL